MEVPLLPFTVGKLRETQTWMLCSNSTMHSREQTLFLLFPLSLKNSISLFISNHFSVKAALGRYWGGGTPIGDGKYLQLCKTSREKKPIVLDLAGVDLIFFTVTGTGLCFGFVLRKVLISITFCYCWPGVAQSQDLFLLHQWGGWGCSRRGHGQDSWSSLTKWIFHTTGHHTQYIKWVEGRRWKGRYLEWHCLPK